MKKLIKSPEHIQLLSWNSLIFVQIKICCGQSPSREMYYVYMVQVLLTFLKTFNHNITYFINEKLLLVFTNMVFGIIFQKIYLIDLSKNGNDLINLI